ncbi:peptidoglycan DD-metalloendopeptidase family protein [Nocardioides sp. NPDC051685]|uniref:peptidoglycan DD-metalloendopeptidase family protein n=1 Tax=Nocardioides sp. NPDC051685 TaxID=3364334 RepID=UPI0037B2EAF6
MTSYRLSDRARALVAALFLVVLIAPAHPALGTPRAEVAPPGASLGGAVGHGEGPSPVGGAEDVPQGEWPLAPQPEVVRRFDPPDAPWGAGHRGVDLRGSPGQVVHTALGGTVAFAGSIAGKPVVAIDHGETRTTYEPVVATVRGGDRVTAGASIGRLSTASSHCWPRSCLHWGLIRNSDHVYLDPLTLVGGGPKPVRLLPLWRNRRT